MPNVKILKFDEGSRTDEMLRNVQARLHASTGVEAFRRGLAIADTITALLTDEKTKGRKLYVENPDGSRQEIILAI